MTLSASSLLALAGGALLCLSAVAEEPAKEATPRAQRWHATVAVLDLSRVVEQYAPFQSKMAELKADIERQEEQVKREKERMRKVVEQLNASGPSADPALLREVEEYYARLQARMCVDVPDDKNFMKREAQIYYSTHRDIAEEVGKYAEANHIDIVLRMSLPRAGNESPEAVLGEIHQNVPWFVAEYDITAAIVAAMDRRAKGRAADATATSFNPEPTATGQ
jgi:hypothetical protein